jgi:hypothetical protein
MKDISRIKEIMGITEEQRPVTAPINVSALVKLLGLLVKQNPDTSFYDVEYDSLEMDKIIKATKYIGVAENEKDIRDFLVAFTELNSDLIDDENFNVNDYRIPEKKNFEWEGEEFYNASISNYYKGEIEAYDEESPKHWIYQGDWEIYNGEDTGREEHRTWDVEQEITDINEKPKQTESVTLKEQSEGGKPLINTELLLKLITYTLINLGGDYYMGDIQPDDQFMDKIDKNLKLVGIKEDYLTLDYIFSFCKLNSELIDNENFEIGEYKIPQKKEFRWTGREVYTATKADTYMGEEIGYSEEFLRNDFKNYELNVTDGRYQDEQVYDTFDMEQIIDNIVGVPINEEISKDLRRLQNLFD